MPDDAGGAAALARAAPDEDTTLTELQTFAAPARSYEEQP